MVSMLVPKKGTGQAPDSSETPHWGSVELQLTMLFATLKLSVARIDDG